MRVKKNEFIIFLIIAGVFLFFYNSLVVNKVKIFRVKLKQVSNTVEVNLPEKEAYLLKIWGEGFPTSVYFNNEIIPHFWYRRRGGIKELYYYLPSELIKKGRNRLHIESLYSYSVRIKNYLGDSELGIILLDASKALKRKKNLSRNIFLPFCISFIFVYFYWWLINFLTQKYSYLNSKRFFLHTFSFFPCFLLFLFLYFASKLLPCEIKFLPSSFFRVSLLLSATTFFVLFIPIFLYKEFKSFQLPKFRTPFHLLIVLINEWLKLNLINKYIRIMIFLIVLVSVFLFTGFELLSQWMANLVYIILIVAVLSNLLKLIKKEERLKVYKKVGSSTYIMLLTAVRLVKRNAMKIYISLFPILILLSIFLVFRGEEEKVRRVIYNGYIILTIGVVWRFIKFLKKAQ
ncbi:MAG: hypothetical protein DRP68_04535 [Candidatus Omnitrophota bacterium]|nr:MAG: hypothetical protein DRP68_04535 [Candidatus Omnitrophota bacterium]RKY39041.1 MAG: hypothetical protein DRP72_00665 [Candidatus Omnitrophota bacterium]